MSRPVCVDGELRCHSRMARYRRERAREDDQHLFSSVEGALCLVVVVRTNSPLGKRVRRRGNACHECGMEGRAGRSMRSLAGGVASRQLGCGCPAERPCGRHVRDAIGRAIGPPYLPSLILSGPSPAAPVCGVPWRVNRSSWARCQKSRHRLPPAAAFAGFAAAQFAADDVPADTFGNDATRGTT